MRLAAICALSTAVVVAVAMYCALPGNSAADVPPAVPAAAGVSPAATAESLPAPAAHPSNARPAAKGPVNMGQSPTTVSPVAASHQAYLNAMYLSLIPTGERARLSDHYVFGYDIPGLDCGTGCTGLFDGQAHSSFNDVFFNESINLQRNIFAHEAAHAFGFLNFTNYSTPNWATVDGWQSQFHRIAQSFVRTYDAEAWAACVAWKESGFNNRIEQIARVCTPEAATLAMQQLP